MSKFIVHNESSAPDWVVMDCVKRVIKNGKVSGENQFCWATQFDTLFTKLTVHAMKARKDTHTFKVRDEA